MSGERPLTAEERLAVLISDRDDWAAGRRSWTNLGPYPPYTPDVIAGLDAQEVVKLNAAIAGVRADIAARALATPAPVREAEGIDFPRLKRAIANVAERRHLAKDPPIPYSIAVIYGYSKAPADMDAEINAEYAALAKGREAVRDPWKPLTGHNHDERGYPTFPVFRAACPQGCDAANVGDIGKPRSVVIDPFDPALQRSLGIAPAEGREAVREAEGIDVERLTRALFAAVPGYQRWLAYPADTHTEIQNRTAALDAELRSHAEAIAREYAALAAPEPGEDR